MTEEQMIHYDGLKKRLFEVMKVISEGESCKSFLSSSFFELFKRIYESDLAFYKEECFKGAKSNLSNIPNFLGRWEGVESFYVKITKSLIDNMDNAIKHKLSIEEEMAQVLDDMKEPEYNSQDDPGGSI